MDASAVRIDYDVEAIGSAEVKRGIEIALSDLGLRRRQGVWRSLLQSHSGFPQSPTLVVADLHRLPDGGRLDCWSAGPSSMAYVFLVRTTHDRKRLRDPEFALRLNNEKFFLLDIAPDPSSRGREASALLTGYFRQLVERLEPGRLRFARFISAEGLLLLEFSDGLKRTVPWADLPFAARVDLVPATASTAEHGQSLMILDSEGRPFDVDAGALRALVDPQHRRRLEKQDALERQSIGHMIRAVREEFGLSQETLAARSGIPQESLSRLENGRRDPRLDTLRKLAAGYDIALSDLLTRLGAEQTELAPSQSR